MVYDTSINVGPAACLSGIFVVLACPTKREHPMADIPRFRFPDLILLLLVVAVAGGVRAWYVMSATNNGAEASPFQVQGQGLKPDYDAGIRLRGQLNPSEQDALIHNIQEHKWFGSLAPLADAEEKTAHVAPGY